MRIIRSSEDANGLCTGHGPGTCDISNMTNEPT